MTRLLLPPLLLTGLPLFGDPPFESMTMVRVPPPRPDPGGRPLPRPRPAPRVGDD